MLRRWGLTALPDPEVDPEKPDPDGDRDLLEPDPGDDMGRLEYDGDVGGGITLPSSTWCADIELTNVVIGGPPRQNACIS